MVTPKQSKKILVWGIESALKLLFDLFDSKKEKPKEHEITDYLYGQLSDSKISKQKISKTVYELKRSNYIDFPDGDSVVLTNKAKMKLIDKYVEKSGEDKKRRLVSFDIPEIRRTNRNKFRAAIKKMGYVQIQKSLWASNCKAGELVEAAALEYKVSDYVAYFVIESSNIEEHISKILKQKEKNS